MWEVHYSLEASTYLEDNGSLISLLFFAMEALAERKGFPPPDTFEQMQGLIYWEVEKHWVVYRRIATRSIVRILVIKPE